MKYFTSPWMSLALGCSLLLGACHQSPRGEEQHDLAAAPVVIPVESRVAEAEDPNLLWLPPKESTLTAIDVPLKDIPELVETARQEAQAALESSDDAVLLAARENLFQVQSALYGLAVRMRGEWSMMEYQGFLSRLRYHEILDLSQALADRRAYLHYQAWLWDRPQEP